MRGSRRVIGSWKINPIPAPRSFSRCLGGSRSRSVPAKTSSPSMAAPRGSKPIKPRPRVDLPQPDSPTRPSTSPGRNVRLTPSTAWTGPFVPAYQIRRSRTRRMSPVSPGPVCTASISIAVTDASWSSRERLRRSSLTTMRPIQDAALAVPRGAAWSSAVPD